MKREYVDFEALTSYNELYNGYIRATSGSKGDREDAIEFGETPDILKKNLLSLQQRLRNGTWQADPGRTFKLFTEKKWRDITVVPIEDRIVHQVQHEATLYPANLRKYQEAWHLGSVEAGTP